MGEVPTYIFWCVIAPIGVGIILALLSLPLSLIGGAIWKAASPRRIGLIASSIMALPVIAYYGLVLYEELTRTTGPIFPADMVATNFVSGGVALIVMTATCVFISRRLAVATLSKRGHN